MAYPGTQLIAIGQNFTNSSWSPPSSALVCSEARSHVMAPQRHRSGFAVALEGECWDASTSSGSTVWAPKSMHVLLSSDNDSCERTDKCVASRDAP